MPADCDDAAGARSGFLNDWRMPTTHGCEAVQVGTNNTIAFFPRPYSSMFAARAPTCLLTATY
jgi:hypothetical protein